MVVGDTVSQLDGCATPWPHLDSLVNPAVDHDPRILGEMVALHLGHRDHPSDVSGMILLRCVVGL